MALLKRILRALPFAADFAVSGGDQRDCVGDFGHLLTAETQRRRESQGRFSPRLSVSAVNDLRASAVIPNWNGRDLLEKYLPSVIAAFAGDPWQRSDRGR